MAERGFAQPRRSPGARLRRLNIGPSDRNERIRLADRSYADEDRSGDLGATAFPLLLVLEGLALDCPENVGKSCGRLPPGARSAVVIGIVEQDHVPAAKTASRAPGDRVGRRTSLPVAPIL